MLTDLGYRVVEASDGADALRRLAEERSVQLLFNDVVLPGGIDGRRLAEEARRLRPKLKVLYTTGYTRNAIVHNGRLDPDVELLSKPFTANALGSRVPLLLDRQ